MIPYECLPRPGSIHKYLTLTILRKKAEDHIVFKDFMMFMSGSLKGIAEAFRLPISKGDFPHRFNILDHQNYCGAIPPLHSDEDFYCLRQKVDPAEVREIEEWYTQQCNVYCSCWQKPCDCFKAKWNMQHELLKYCWLDVDVLAEAIIRFRDTHLRFGEIASDTEYWKSNSIDPFHYCTQSQVAMDFFIGGLKPEQTCAVSSIKHKTNWSKVSIIWLEYQSKIRNEFIYHIGNSEKEYFDIVTETYVDGFAPRSKTCYEFLGCFYHGCPTCYPNADVMHLMKHQSYGQLREATRRKLTTLAEHYAVVSIWECEWKAAYQPTDYEQELSNIILDRDELFYGGRTEVFSPYFTANTTEKIEYHDVCSLYPTVCSHDVLPIKYPRRYFGDKAKEQMHRISLSHPDPIFGYIRCKVRPNPHDILGLLPHRGDGKLVFDLQEKIGTWFTEEIYLAMSQGYIILEVYEILHWSAENRSNNYFKGYMSFFLRMKQEAEGWKKAGASDESPTDEVKQHCIEDLYQLNGNMARMRSEYVEKNDVRRQTAKIYLNCLWGKFAQNSEQESQQIIYGFHQFHKLNYNTEIAPESIRYRHIAGEAYQAIYKNKKAYYRRNARYNIWIAAAVTAHARCRLHKQMIRIGPERILYCDTDSIVFTYQRSLPSLSSRGLGNWVDESKDFGSAIQMICAFAPKTYLLLLEDGSYRIKAKGCRMTIPNKAKCKPDVLLRILLNKCVETSVGYTPEDALLLDHFTIFSNAIDIEFKYATVFSRYSQKVLRVVLGKRVLVPILDDTQEIGDQELFFSTHPLSLYGRIYTVPFHFKFNPSLYYQT